MPMVFLVETVERETYCNFKQLIQYPLNIQNLNVGYAVSFPKPVRAETTSLKKLF